MGEVAERGPDLGGLARAQAGAILTEWGADVVKVEHPETGDPYRGLATVGLHTVFHGNDTFSYTPGRVLFLYQRP